MAGAIYMGTEMDAIIIYLAQSLEAEDLITSTVCQQTPLPIHESMQAAGSGDQIFSRPEMEVIGIGQDDSRSHSVQLIRSKGFDGSLSAHRHEYGRSKNAMGSGNLTKPGSTATGFLYYLKIQTYSSSGLISLVPALSCSFR